MISFNFTRSNLLYPSTSPGLICYILQLHQVKTCDNFLLHQVKMCDILQLHQVYRVISFSYTRSSVSLQLYQAQCDILQLYQVSCDSVAELRGSLGSLFRRNKPSCFCPRLHSYTGTLSSIGNLLV